MKIEKIEITNFRSIREKLLIEASNSNFKIFIGPNNSGKSNILRAINLFFNKETEPRVSYNPNIDLTFGENKT